MVVGIILGTIFVTSGLAFLIARAAEAEEPIIIDVPIDEIPPDEIDQIEIILPGNAEQLITQVGL